MSKFKIPDFTEEQLEEMTREFEAERKARLKELKNFYKSDRFKSIIEQLKKETETGPVGDNSYVEKFLFGDVTNDEFINLFSTLGDPEVSGLQFREESGDFSPESLVFENMKFSQIHGQGTAFFAERV